MLPDLAPDYTENRNLVLEPLRVLSCSDPRDGVEDDVEVVFEPRDQTRRVGRCWCRL